MKVLVLDKNKKQDYNKSMDDNVQLKEKIEALTADVKMLREELETLRGRILPFLEILDQKNFKLWKAKLKAETEVKKLKEKQTT